MDAKLEELKAKKFWGSYTVSKTYNFKYGEIYHVEEETTLKESKKPKNGEMKND